MNYKNLIFALLLASSSHAAVNLSIGSGAASFYTYWTFNNAVATNGGSGLTYNWENVIHSETSNYTAGGSAGYEFNFQSQADTNYTMGQGFLFN